MCAITKSKRKMDCEHCLWFLKVTYKDGKMWRCVY
nr:MAG TPA: WRC protein [Caudoviricetes sp.]